MNDAIDRVSSKRTCSPPVEEMEARGATAARVRIERTCLFTRSSACFFFSFSRSVVGCFDAVRSPPPAGNATTEENALASLALKEETAASATARIGAEGGESEEAEEEVEVEEVDVESGIPPAADATDDAIATRLVCLLATADGALFGAKTTQDVVRCADTTGRATVVVL